MQQLIQHIKQHKKTEHRVVKHTLIVNEDLVTTGALFFIPLERKEYKVLIPAPHHEEVLKNGDPTFQQVVEHRQALFLQ